MSHTAHCATCSEEVRGALWDLEAGGRGEPMQGHWEPTTFWGEGEASLAAGKEGHFSRGNRHAEGAQPGTDRTAQNCGGGSSELRCTQGLGCHGREKLLALMPDGITESEHSVGSQPDNL